MVCWRDSGVRHKRNGYRAWPSPMFTMIRLWLLGEANLLGLILAQRLRSRASAGRRASARRRPSAAGFLRSPAGRGLRGVKCSAAIKLPQGRRQANPGRGGLAALWSGDHQGFMPRSLGAVYQQRRAARVQKVAAFDAPRRHAQDHPTALSATHSHWSPVDRPCVRNGPSRPRAVDVLAYMTSSISPRPSCLRPMALERESSIPQRAARAILHEPATLTGRSMGTATISPNPPASGSSTG